MAAAPFLLLLLIASGSHTGTATAGYGVPHLELPGTPAGSDAPRQGLMDIGCGAFVALLAATPNASDVFQQHLVAGGGGLTVFCPDDKAVAAFAPAFRALPASDRLGALLYHGAAGRFVRARFAGFDWVGVPTLAVADAATNRRQTVLVRDACECGTMRVWSTWPGDDGVARVTKTVYCEEPAPLVLHVVDAVLLREKKLQDACGGGGYLGFLYCRVSLWVVLLTWVTVGQTVLNVRRVCAVAFATEE